MISSLIQVPESSYFLSLSAHARMTSSNCRLTSMRNLPPRISRASLDGRWNCSRGITPLGSGEYHRISPLSPAIGNQPLVYAETSSDEGIIAVRLFGTQRDRRIDAHRAESRRQAAQKTRSQQDPGS